VHGERKNARDPSPLEVKEVLVGERRYVVCYNPEQARKDAADRSGIVAALRATLKQGDKALVGNEGFRRGQGVLAAFPSARLLRESLQRSRGGPAALIGLGARGEAGSEKRCGPIGLKSDQ